MASVIYPKAKEAMLQAYMTSGTFAAGTPKATLVDLADYTYDAAHDFFADVPSGARVATVTLGTLTYTNGAFGAADTTFATVTGDPSEAVIIWTDTGSDATSRLIAFIDNGGTLTVTPNGNDITLDLPVPVFQL